MGELERMLRAGVGSPAHSPLANPSLLGLSGPAGVLHATPRSCALVPTTRFSGTLSDAA